MAKNTGTQFICALACFFMWQVEAQAQDLTPENLSYLEEEFGLCADNPVLNRLTPQERSRLRDIFTFDEPWSRVYPYIFKVRLFGVLDTANIRQCNEWSQENRSPPCPPIADSDHQAGKDVADFQCNACHLFGTPDAPGFFQLARDGNTGVNYLSDALTGGHTMSPINLPRSELEALSGYIASLTCEPKSKP